MALKPVPALRALLACHAQASWNRTTKEMGKHGAVLMVIGVALLAGVVMLPILFALGAAGYGLGSQLPKPWALSLTGGILFGLSVLMGLVGGVLGGAKSLDWERLRGFPLRPWTLLAAELVGGLGDLVTLMVALVQLLFVLGLILARPASAPLLLLLLVESLALLLLVQLLVGGLAGALVKRLRLVLMILGGLAWATSTLGSAMMSRRSAHPRGAARQEVSFTADQESLQRYLGLAQRAADALPSTAGVRSVTLASEGRLGAALAWHLYPLALILVLGLAGSRLLAREAQVQEGVAASRDPQKLWSFGGPAAGIARLQWLTLMDSYIGRFGFVIPLMTVVLIKGPFAQLRGQGAWGLPGAFAYLSLTSAQVLFNQFGLDGHAVKGLLLLPLPARELLKGKMLGFGLYLGIQALILLVLMALLGNHDPLALLGCLFMGGCCVLVMASVGQRGSIWMPRLISRRSLKNGGIPLPMMLLSMGTSLACTLSFGGLYMLLAWLAPLALLPAMAALFAVCLWIHVKVMDLNADYLQAHREKLVEALG